MDNSILVNDESFSCHTCGLRRAYAMVDSVFDMLTVGIACVRKGGSLMYVNRPALSMLDRCGILTTQFKQSYAGVGIGDLALNKLSLDISHTVVMRRQDTALQIQIEPFQNACMPRNGEQERRSGALLILRELGYVAMPSMTQLKTLYGFTQAEARLALELCSGATVAECAQTLGVTVATVRTHLRAVMEKTGSQRQAELLTILLSAPSTSIQTDT